MSRLLALAGSYAQLDGEEGGITVFDVLDDGGPGVALALDPATGALEHRGSVPVPGPFPTYLALDPVRRLLLTAAHGGFDHVEKVIGRPDGTWGVEYVYDDSTVLVHRLD
ncbi:MAG: hypothetical protein ACFNME_06325, partial [Actinomyces dentalis]